MTEPTQHTPWLIADAHAPSPVSMHIATMIRDMLTEDQKQPPVGAVDIARILDKAGLPDLLEALIDLVRQVKEARTSTNIEPEFNPASGIGLGDALSAISKATQVTP